MQLNKPVMVVLSPTIGRECNLDIQEIARALAAMAWAYALFQIRVSWIAGRLGPMRTIGLRFHKSADATHVSAGSADDPEEVQIHRCHSGRFRVLMGLHLREGA
ncbi:hypothetical protein [Lichenicola sp.]|uniref:hypothetical protein n=1 Tax=Lichenicola sp. TaxID=2804529 RepID=UPI003B0059CC